MSGAQEHTTARVHVQDLQRSLLNDTTFPRSKRPRDQQWHAHAGSTHPPNDLRKDPGLDLV